jgi:peptidoglycan/xylan/chitin deacetylase (PgdA/CDA1 family)
MLRVLTYHRIAKATRYRHLNPRLISASPDAFGRHMRFLATHYNVVHLDQVIEAAAGGRKLPRRAVLITFDDAYRDFLEVAWPILHAHRLPATLFVPTAYPDRPDRAFWWDRMYRCFTDPRRVEFAANDFGIEGTDTLPLHTTEERTRALHTVIEHFKRLSHDDGMHVVDRLCIELGDAERHYDSVLRWEELYKLTNKNISLCAHTRWHPLLTRVSAERARAEIVGSQSDLQREIGHVHPVFSYPDGAHDDTVVDIVRRAGFNLAFTQRDGHNNVRRADTLRLCRTNVTPRTTLPILRLRMQPWFARVDRWRHERNVRVPLPRFIFREKAA